MTAALWRQAQTAMAAWFRELMGHLIHEVIDAQVNGLYGRWQGVARLIDPFPEIADIMVVIDDHAQPPAVVKV